jgi:hypothetical protein
LYDSSFEEGVGMIDDLDVYDKEVRRPLLSLQKKGVGKVIELSEGVLGFVKGKEPKVLVTSCYHASEIYGTYQSVINLIESINHDMFAIPVIDIPRFCTFKNGSDDCLGQNPNIPIKYFIRDSIKGYNSNPNVLNWQYGDKDATGIIKDISYLVEGSELVIDIHNSCVDKFMMMTALTGNYGEWDYLSSLLKILDQNCGIYTGNAGFSFVKLDNGLFSATNNKTITAFCADKGVTNIVLEVPIYSVDCTRQGFSDLAEFNASILHSAISLFYKIKEEKMDKKIQAFGKEFGVVHQKPVEYKPVEDSIKAIENMKELEQRLDELGFQCLIPRSVKWDPKKYVKIMNEVGRYVTLDTYFDGPRETIRLKQSVNYQISGLEQDVNFVMAHLDPNKVVYTCPCR